MHGHSVFGEQQFSGHSVAMIHVHANMTGSPLERPAMRSGLGAFFLFTIVWVVLRYRGFRLPRAR